jgi:hypothetical protein
VPSGLLGQTASAGQPETLADLSNYPKSILFMAHSLLLAAVARVRLAAMMVILSTLASTSYAAVHLWEITEVFSSADGSVQFIEMFDTSPGETLLGGSQLQFNADGVMTSYTFPGHLPPTTPTAGKSLLIATSGFSAVAGVTPDYARLVPGQFFNPNVTNLTVTFTGSGSELQALNGDLPTDGLHSWTQSGSAINSPKNINDQMGFVDPTPDPTGDYNGNEVVDAADYVLWRKTLNQMVDPDGSGADGDGDGTVDPGDYTFWRERFGQDVGGSGANDGGAVPEPTIGAFCLAACLAICAMYRKRRPALSGSQPKVPREPLTCAILRKDSTRSLRASGRGTFVAIRPGRDRPSPIAPPLAFR